MRKECIIFSALIAICCGKKEECPPQGQAKVNFVLYTVIPSQNPENTGYVIRQGADAGYGGVVVVPSYQRETYRAFELSAPHLPRGANTILQINEDGLKAICPADGAEFMLSNGMPLSSGKGKSPCGLVEYPTIYMPSERVIIVKN